VQGWRRDEAGEVEVPLLFRIDADDDGEVLRAGGFDLGDAGQPR
jgi:hypothetical protein